MEYAVDLTPRSVPPSETKYRRIETAIPAPEPAPILKKLCDLEPGALPGQPPVVSDHAEGFQAHDSAGNCWIGWSAGVLFTNAGHGRKEIVEALASRRSEKVTA